jgi:hypothetical protein
LASTSIKQQLYSHCIEYVRSRSAIAEEAIRGAQASANEETKSSAGDKYETGRAMAQLEIEKNTAQLAEARKLLKAMEQIRDTPSLVVKPGSLVITNYGNFYLSISAGQVVIDKQTYFAVSPASPIGQKMVGLGKKSSFILNGKTFDILEVL